MQYLNAPKMNNPKHILNLYRNTKGFTLMELIIVIVLLGIIGLMGANFISTAFKGFSDTDIRNDIYEEGKTVLVRMERELRNALPNAVNLAGATDLQFGIIDETALDCSSLPCVFGQYRDNNPVGRSFIRDQRNNTGMNGRIISIYNRNWSPDFSGPAASLRLYQVTGIVGSRRMNLHKNILAASPNRRFYPVARAIRYYLSGTTLIREPAAVNIAGPTLFPGGTIPLANNISSLTFNYQPGTLVRNALVTVDFTISRSGINVTFHKEIQIRNVP